MIVMTQESIILVSSNNSEEFLPRLTAELQGIRSIGLKNAIDRNRIRLFEHAAATYSSLSALLNSAEGQTVTMLHYSGHSSKLGLQVQSMAGNGRIDNEDLTTLLKAHKKFRFVFLNGCYSDGLALDLAGAGIPFVIGTTDHIRDGQAAAIATRFYQFLASAGKTVEEAFVLTKAYFMDEANKEDPLLSEAFRSFKKAQTPENRYPWNLYKSASLQALDEVWSLVPARVVNRVLSGEKGKMYKLRVFCIYDGDGGAELYRALRVYFDRKGILFHSLLELGGGDLPDEADLRDEIGAAEAILHVVSDQRYIDLWNRFPALPEYCTTRKNYSVAWGENFSTYLAVLGQQLTFAGDALPNDGYFTSIEEIRRLPQSPSIADICHKSNIFLGLEALLKPIVDENYIDVKELERAIYDFDFDDEVKGCRITDTVAGAAAVFFILIEGTPQCAQNLFYKKLRHLARLGKNVQRFSIAFSSPEGNIMDEEGFYLAVARAIKAKSAVPAKYAGAEACIGLLESQLENNDVILLLDDLGEGAMDWIEKKKTLIGNFWSNLDRLLPAGLPSRLFVFAINRSLPAISFLRDQALWRTDEGIDSIMIRKLSRDEFRRWYAIAESRFTARRRFEQRMQKTGEDIINRYRQESIDVICTTLVGEEKSTVITKILDYDSFI
jgi:hypothetical protein